MTLSPWIQTQKCVSQIGMCDVTETLQHQCIVSLISPSSSSSSSTMTHRRRRHRHLRCRRHTIIFIIYIHFQLFIHEWRSISWNTVVYISYLRFYGIVDRRDLPHAASSTHRCRAYRPMYIESWDSFPLPRSVYLTSLFTTFAYRPGWIRTIYSDPPFNANRITPVPLYPSSPCGSSTQSADSLGV